MWVYSLFENLVLVCQASWQCYQLLFKAAFLGALTSMQIGLGGRFAGVRLKVDSCSQQVSIYTRRNVQNSDMYITVLLGTWAQAWGR